MASWHHLRRLLLLLTISVGDIHHPADIAATRKGHVLDSPTADSISFFLVSAGSSPFCAGHSSQPEHQATRLGRLWGVAVVGALASVRRFDICRGDPRPPLTAAVEPFFASVAPSGFLRGTAWRQNNKGPLTRASLWHGTGLSAAARGECIRG